jgi:hypothetical protein
MTAVRLDDGRDAVRAYVIEQAMQGLEHVRKLVNTDTDSILAAIEGLSEEEGNRLTLEGEWTPAQVLADLNSSLARSHSRLEAMSSGHEWVSPPGVLGQTSDAPRSFQSLRQEYAEGMRAIINVLEAAEASQGLELTVDHIEYGPFTWLQWAVYSHHVHTSDHIGQLNAARARVKGGA